jgi:Uma2 family endonuclease
MSATTQLTTAEELLKLPRGRFRSELVRGELRRMAPSGYEHGKVAARLTVALGAYVDEHGLGDVCAAETGFKLESDPDTVLAPDTAFISRGRVDEVGRERGYGSGAPDLVSEVVSPNDRVGEVEQKVESWLSFGVKLVWVISPKLRTVTVYRSHTDVRILTEMHDLDGEDIVPGFRYPGTKLFAR